MIRESQSWTSSELIYLFVDGEADDVQKSMLFTALANDAGLQAEFSDALRINAAIKDADEQPPQHVTAALFRNAGFNRTAEEAAGITVAAGALTLTQGAGTGFRLRSVLVPFVSAFVGGIIALFLAPEILRQSNNESRFALSEQGRTAQSATTVHGDAAPNTEVTNAAISAHAYRKTLPGTATSGVQSSRAGIAAIDGKNSRKGTTAEGSAPVALQANELEEGREVGMAERNEKGIENTIRPVAPASDVQAQGEKNAEPMRAITPAAEPIEAVTSEEIKKEITDREILAAEETENIGQNLLYALSAEPSVALQVGNPRFALQVRGITELEVFPHRSLNTGKPAAFENIGITGLYALSRNHAIGIEVGREYHPLYVPTTAPSNGGISVADTLPPDPGIGITINGASPDLGNFVEAGSLTGNGGSTRNANLGTSTGTPQTAKELKDAQSSTGYNLEPRSTWIGLAYQFRANPIDRLGLIRPYVQAVVGGTQIGPVGKGTLGLSWTPDSRVSFNLGVEGTAILYRNNGDWYSSRKLGLTYSAQVSF